MLGLWLQELAQVGVNRALINTHYLADQVQRYIADSQPGGMTCRLSFEKKLLGSAGTLLANQDFLEEAPSFLIVYGDNYAPGVLQEMVAKPLPQGFLGRVALFRSKEPTTCGIVTLDEHGVITSFEEKPAEPKSDLASGSIFWLSRAALELFRPEDHDLGTDVLPRFVGKLVGLVATNPILDIGTPERLRCARRMHARRARPTPLRQQRDRA